MKTTEIWPIARLVALLIQVPAVMAFVSIVPAAAVGDASSALAFAVTAVLSMALGALIVWLIPKGHEPDFRETMVASAAGWLVAALIGAAPFLLVAHLTPVADDGAVLVFRGFWNAFFESMSGFTTTGLSMVERPASLPAGLQWWRSFTQWIGGLGVIILVLTVVHPERGLSKLFRAEGHEKSFGHNVLATVRETWLIYVGFTVLGAALLRGLGMPGWESVNHAMTAVSTGGFTVTDNGLAGYGNGPRVGVALLTLLGAISFVWYQHLLHREWAKGWGDIQFRTLLGVLVIGAGLLGLTHVVEGGGIEPLTVALHWTAAVTTSGFASTGLEDWSGATKILLILAMIVGGSTGSAAGGIKLLRVATLVREIGGFFRVIVLKPGQLIFRPATLAGELDKNIAGQFTVAALFVAMWVGMVIAAGYLLALFCGPDVAIIDVIFDAASALSITGLSTGVVSPELHAGAKAIFIVLMWAGRLEVLPVLVFFAWIFGSRKWEDNSA